MNPVTTANKLKTLRNLKGLSPEQVAEKAKLNLDDYKALEEGKTAVQHDKLEKACNALGLDVKEWFETDSAKVAINNGEIKDGNNISCETCYLYQRSEEDMDIIKDVSLALKEIVKKLDTDWIAIGIEKFAREHQLKFGNDKEE